MSGSTMLLGAYCVAVFAAAVLGGWLSRRLQMTHTRTQLVMSLVAGLMLGVAFFHLLPHAIFGEHMSVDGVMLWLVAGLVFMLLLLRLFHFHQHDFVPAHSAPCLHEHPPGEAEHGEHAISMQHPEHDHFAPEVAPHESAHKARHSAGWLGLLLGLSVHTVVDGFALGAVMRAEPGHEAGVLGVGVFAAILLHKPLDALTIETVMAAAHVGRRLRLFANLLFASLCPATALLFWWFVDPVAQPSGFMAAALAFSAGAFICIALSDLLPEIQFHSHDRLKLTALFVVGLALAWSIGAIEAGTGHA